MLKRNYFVRIFCGVQMKHNFKSQQSGFTLIEIAIVLVIIGLLLGGVLKGQEMIENSRIKSVVADMRGVSAAYNSYVDRFRALPGDETAATMGARGWTGAAGGNGNGVLAINLNQTFNNGGEQAAFWRALRASGFAVGDPNAATNATGMPRAGNNGLLGVTVSPYGLVGISSCVSALTTKQARGVDTTIDGSEGNSFGEARGLSSGANPTLPATGAPAATAYNETTITNLWTMCRPL
jgi:prepilin-type N-terminal cleavage/methylation domain-containing protein